MKRGILLLLCLLLCGAVVSASAVTVAGYDSPDTNHNWAENRYFERAAAAYGLEFSFTQYSDEAAWTAAKKEMLTGSALPEVLFKAALTTAETQSLSAAGVLLDLAPYIDSDMPNLSAILAAHPDWRRAITLPDGTIPVLPKFDELHAQNAMWINTDWLSKLGLSMPTTAEELTEVLRAFRDGDPNGNGKKDEIPLSFIGMWDLRFLGHAFGVMMDDYNLCLNSEGQVISPVTSAENRAFLSWLSLLWREKLIDPSGFTTSDTFRTISDTKSPMIYGVYMAPTPISIIPAASLSQYSLLPPLTDAQGKQQYRDVLGMVDRGAFALTKTCVDPAAVLRWIDSLYSEAGMRLAFLGEEGTEYVIHSDGTWAWSASEEEQYNTVQPRTTIASGTSIPGYLAASMQQHYENTATSRIIDMLAELNRFAVSPMPSLFLTEAQQAEIAALHSKLGPAVQQGMTSFVTGDTPLTDDTWNAFCEAVRADGLDRLIDIFNSLLQ